MKNLTRDEAATRAEVVDVVSYDVSLDLRDDAGFDSWTVARFRATPGASTFVELDATALHVVLNGRAVDLGTVTGNRIPLDDLAATNELAVTARCAYSNTGEGLHRFVDPADGAVYLYAQSFLDDAQRVFACFDQPDLKAAVTLDVSAPAEWTVIGNERGERGPDGTWRFATTQRMSTYLFTVAAGPWAGAHATHDGIDLGVWCRRSLAAHLDSDELFEITARCLDFQQHAFGRAYPFGPTYDQLFVPEFNAGAMENPGAVTFSEEFLFRSRVTEGQRRERAVVIAHEMAHMWFGDLVTMRWWDDLWLNESFAELLGFHTVDRTGLYGDVWADFATSRKAWGYRADAMPTTHPVAGRAADTRSALLDFDGISYAKGASVLRQLMASLGEDVFLAGVQAYVERNAFGNTSLDDLLGELARASGRDLSQWADSWLRTAGTSTLRVADGAVEQTSPPPDHVLREHQIRVGMFDVDGGELRRRSTYDLSVEGASTPLPDLTPRPDLVLLNDGDLTFAKIRFDDRSLATVTSSLALIREGQARSLCWAALWDAVRDAELAPSVFLHAVQASARGETDPGVVANLLEQATLAAGRYTPAAHQEARLRELADFAWSAAARADAGSDLQLTWVTAGIESATPRDVTRLQLLLDGRDVPAGLTVDTELRWLVVRRLAALGALDEADIDAELDRDRTSAGERHADFARAARPDAAAKAAAWRAVTDDADIANHRARALARGYWQRGQDDLLADWVPAYFDVIPELWRERSPQIAETLARYLFPATVVTDDVIHRADRFLRGDVPAGLRRVVLEAQDDLRRAVAAQRREADG